MLTFRVHSFTLLPILATSRPLLKMTDNMMMQSLAVPAEPCLCMIPPRKPTVARKVPRIDLSKNEPMRRTVSRLGRAELATCRDENIPDPTTTKQATLTTSNARSFRADKLGEISFGPQSSTHGYTCYWCSPQSALSSITSTSTHGLCLHLSSSP
jgi:hypothetical protein